MQRLSGCSLSPLILSDDSLGRLAYKTILLFFNAVDWLRHMWRSVMLMGRSVRRSLHAFA